MRGKPPLLLAFDPGVEGKPFIEEALRLLRPPGLEELDDPPPGREIHDRPVDQWVVEAAELQENALDPSNISQMGPRFSKQLDGVVVAPSEPEAAPLALLRVLPGRLVSHGAPPPLRRSGWGATRRDDVNPEARAHRPSSPAILDHTEGPRVKPAVAGTARRRTGAREHPSFPRKRPGRTPSERGSLEPRGAPRYGSAMRQLTIIATSLWLGAMGFFAFVAAPVAFGVLGRESAGRLIAALMPRYHWLGLVLGILALCGIIGRWGRGGGNLLDRLPLILVCLMLALTAYSLIVLLPQVDALRLVLPPGRSAEALAVSPEAARFARLHMVSTLLGLTVMAVGIAVVILEAVRHPSAAG